MDELIMCALGVVGVLATACVIASGPIFWYHWLAFVAFAAMIPLSSMFKERP